MSRKILLTVLLSIFAAMSSSVDAQINSHWKKIFPYAGLPFFWDAQHGLIGDESGIFKTKDGGKTWKQCNTPVVGWRLSFLSLYMRDTLNGWATLLGQANDQNVWETTDGGENWTDLAGLQTAGWTLRTQAGLIVQSAGGLVFRDALHGVKVFSENPYGGSGPIYGGNARTTDGGKTWIPINDPTVVFPSVSGNVSDSNLLLGEHHGLAYSKALGCYFIMSESAAYPHPCAYSYDDGETWHSTNWSHSFFLGPTGDLGAAGRAVYFQGVRWPGKSSGIWRSLDGGQSFQLVSGPNQDIDRRFCVPPSCDGGIVVAGGYNGGTSEEGVWITTDGGDGLLRSSVLPVTTTSFVDGGQPLASGDTIIVTDCDTTRLDFRATFKGCDYIVLDSLALSDAGLNKAYSVLHNRKLLEGAPSDTATLVIQARSPGVFHALLHARILRSDYTDEDTTLPIVLVVNKNPGVLSISRRAVAFESQTLCSALERTDTIRISASGCEAVQVDSIVFRPDPGSTDFGFASSTGFIIASSDPARAFPITFKPTHPAKEWGWIYIYSSNGVDSILVTGEGVADSRAFIADGDTLRVKMCDSSDAVLRITNTTCGSLVIDSVSIADGFTLPLASNGQPQLPLALGRDREESISLRYAPSAGTLLGTSSVNVIAHVRYLGIGDTVAFDTVLTLPLVVTRGIPSLALSTESLDLGDVSTCADDSIWMSVFSTGCDTLWIQSASLASGSNGLTLTHSPRASLTTGSSDSISVKFIPSGVGLVTDTIILVTNAGTKLIPITATGVAGDKLVAQSTSSLDFGSLPVCEDSTQSVTLSNKGCADITITSADINGAGFAYDGTLPIVLKPGESTTVKVHSIADTTGHPTTMTGSLQFTSTAANSLPAIPLSRGFIYPAKLSIQVVGDASAHAGDIVKFNVLLEGDVPKGMSALYFDLSNDDDLLSFVSSSGVSVTNTTGGTPVATRTFRLSPVTDTGIIGELTFRAYLAKSNTTALTLSNLRFDYPYLTVPPDCIASIDGSGSNFTYLFQCGEGLIQQFMNGEYLAIESVAPNPASNSVVVRLRGAESLTMLDVLGRSVLTVAPSHEVTLDVSRLNPGTYYLRATAAGGVRTTRIVIQR